MPQAAARPPLEWGRQSGPPQPLVAVMLWRAAVRHLWTWPEQSRDGAGGKRNRQPPQERARPTRPRPRQGCTKRRAFLKASVMRLAAGVEHLQVTSVLNAPVPPHGTGVLAGRRGGLLPAGPRALARWGG